MTNTLRKASMKKSHFKINVSTAENEQIYEKQRNFCCRFFKKERKKYYNNLDLKVL